MANTASPARPLSGTKFHLESHALHLVLSEISAVTSAMRKNTRWSASSYAVFSGLTSYSYSPPQTDASATAATSTSALSASMGLRSAHKGKQIQHTTSAKGEDGVGLLSGFALLRAQIRTCHDFASFPLDSLLSPFLRVILSPRTTGPITSAALQAVHRFLVHGLIRLSAPGARQAIAEIAHATSHCRFEASEASADELVLLRILAVMRELICEPVQSSGLLTPLPDHHASLLPTTLADYLGDDSICEMMETGLTMCCQMRLSNLLRRTAEQSMITMLRALFSRLDAIPSTADEFFSTDPNAPEHEPEHATLAADPVGQDAELLEKKRRRMTMPDPTSNAFPAAAAQTLKTLKELGEAQEQAEQETGAEAAAQPKTESNNGASDGAEGEKAAEDSESKQEQEADASVDSQTSAEVPSAPEPEQDEKEEQPPDTQEDKHEDQEQDNVEPSEPLDLKPYGLPAMKDVLRVVVSLLDPASAQHTDTMRMLGMSMLTSVLEVAGHSIGRFPSLRAMIQDSACKHLFMLARSENVVILSFSLRCISTLFETMREHLKLQHELFLGFLLDRLAPTFPLSAEPWHDRALGSAAKRSASSGPSSSDAGARSGTPDVVGSGQATGNSGAGAPPPPPPPPLPKTSDRAPVQGEARELLLETFALLFRTFDQQRISDYLVDLWINYDCNTDCDDLFEKVINFLCRAVHAANPQHPQHQDSTQLFALDALLSFVTAMTDRQELEADGEAAEPLYQSLSEQKGKKAAILAGAARFNAKPKDGLAYLDKIGLVDSSYPREEGIARFLKDCPRLDKKLLGDYLSRPDNIKVLQSFMSLFDFTDKPIAEALRELLETFRLPGEAQQIDRITQTFAKAYFNAKPAAIASEDAVYVLAFSVIMLNTDLHNPQNRRRMTVEDYRRNLRGVNDGKDFDPEYLGAIYDTIRRREIVMPEEHAGQLGFDYAWKELLRKSRTAGPLLAGKTCSFDREMFQHCWKPIFSSIAFAFSSFRDENMVERAISGIRQCAILASKFGMAEIFDFMVHSLASATGLLDSALSQTPSATNTTVEVEGQSITVSPLSVRFGINFKGQLAAVVLFAIANGNGDAIRTGWSDIFEIFKNLFANSLLPAPMLQMDDLVEGKISIPLKPKKPAGPSPADPRAQGGGLFSTLSSYLLSPYSTGEPAPYEATEEDVEATLSTVDCVASCRLEELYEQVQHLAPESLAFAVEALRDLADSLTVDKVQAREQMIGSDGTATPTAATTGGGALPYDAKVTFILEMLVAVAIGRAEHIAETWSVASEHISAVLRSAKSYHSMTVEREVVTLLRLLRVAANDEGLRDQLFLSLDLLRTLPAEMRLFTARQLLAGLRDLLRGHPGLARSPTECQLVMSLISDNAYVRNVDAARLGFEALQAAITPESFGPALALLSDFADGADTTRWRERATASMGRRATLTEKKEMADVERVHRDRGVDAVGLMAGLSGPEVLRALSRQWTNAYAPVRQAAVTALQRALLSCDEEPVSLFRSTLFPMLDELLKPHVFQLDPAGMFETRIRAAALTCKAILHLLARLDDLQPTWLAVLDYMDRLTASASAARRDPLVSLRAVPQHLPLPLI